MRRLLAVLKGGRRAHVRGKLRSLGTLAFCLCLVPASIAGCATAQPTETPAPPVATAVAPTVATARRTDTAVPTKATSQVHVNGRSGAVITPETVEQLELVHTLHGHTDRVYGLCFSTDGLLLASASRDGTIRVWDVASRREIHTLDGTGDWDVFFAPDDEHVASTEGSIWDLVSGEQVQSIALRAARATFSADGGRMASAGFNAPIEVWDVETGQVVQTLEGHTDRVFGLAFSPDGLLLASGSGMGPSDVSDYTLKIWDLESGRELHALQGHSGDIHAVAFSPGGALVASASTDCTVKLWDVRSGELVHTLWHRDGLWDVAFAPDGTLLASGGVDRQVRVWEVAGGRQLHSLRHGDEVMAVAFSPDGSLLAAAGYDNLVYLWGLSCENGDGG